MNNILYKTYRKLSEDNYEELMEKAIFVLDANVLLDLYRLPVNSSSDLMSIFTYHEIAERLWIPFQVFLEYSNNRLSTISGQRGAFDKVKDLMQSHLSEIESLYTSLHQKLEDLKLKNRHALINPDEYIDTDFFKSSKDKLNQFLDDLEKKEKEHIDVNDVDKIQAELIELFEGKIGEPISAERLKQICIEGDKRYELEIPPGFKDKSKKGNNYFQTIAYPKKFGDLILWNELIDKINANKLTHIIFVTSDVKEDWWDEKRGKRLGVRPELLDEIYTKCPTLELFHIYELYNFMERAKEHFDIQIADGSIEDSRELIDLMDQLEITNSISPSSPSIELLVNKILDEQINASHKRIISNFEHSDYLSLSKYFNVRFKEAFPLVPVSVDQSLHGIFLRCPKAGFHNLFLEISEVYLGPFSLLSAYFKGTISNDVSLLSIQISNYEMSMNEALSRMLENDGIVRIESKSLAFGFVEILATKETIDLKFYINNDYILKVKPDFDQWQT